MAVDKKEFSSIATKVPKKFGQFLLFLKLKDVIIVPKI